MPRILLVKTSSLGDVVHNLPVASDIRQAIPDANIDWVVEEGFRAIPRLHPSVGVVLPVAVRRWRKSPLHPATRSEIAAFLARLRSVSYDAIIDTQGLFKSALVARAARGVRHGLDWASSREPLALFYDRTYRVPWGAHAVERNRSLAAQALEYRTPSHIDYGIRRPADDCPLITPDPYVVLLHATSAPSKLWPDRDWIGLGRALRERGFASVLPWGDSGERDRSERLGAAIPGSIVPQRLPLEDLARVIAQSRAVVGVDTGLTHLAAASGTPTVGIYCSTDPAATGVYGCPRGRNLGGIGHPPSVAEVIAALAGDFR